MLGHELVGLLKSGLRPAALASRFAKWRRRDGFWADAVDTIPIRLTAMDVDELDITKRDAVRRVLGTLRPTLVINAAAYTDVDGCESCEAEASAVNASGPANLAEACRECDAWLVHVSTDYVFDGNSAEPYVPEHPIAPRSAYGRTKAAGEEAVRRILPDAHTIVRSSWLFGGHGRNFVKTILRLAAERSELRVVTDQVGCPTYAADLAAALSVAGLGGVAGTHHFCNVGVCSWNQFAAEIVRLSGTTCRILPQTTAELNRPASRPAYSALSTASFAAATGIVPRLWPEALLECLEPIVSR
ncbi:MAG: dTDP-4-dehydrorhamnose reductase [Phycisphaerae bacterium]|nr:dTDP-4-dehydrorhamnose reductase [Phycisphaerae bacterium]